MLSKFNLCRYDVAGYSPLAHCTSGMGDMAATLEIVMKVLGPAGADPNAVNRFKVPPLEDAIMTSRADTLTVLLELGADPRKEHVKPGHSAYSMAHAMAALPEARGLFAAALERVAACGSSALVGREVTVRDLASRADLNGRAGVVKSLVVAKGSYEVELTASGSGGGNNNAPAETISVKPTSLRLASALTGSVVRLHGLKAEPALNGRRGKCVRYAADRGRFEVVLTPTGDEPSGASGSASGAGEEPRTVHLKASNLAPYESSVKGHAGTCGHCGKAPGEKKFKYCALCFAMVYCSGACSKAHYKAHKPACKARQAASVRINIAEAKAGLGGLHHASVNYNSKAATHTQGVEMGSKKAFTLKVSAVLVAEFDALAAAVEARGIKVHNSPRGVKAYFTARLIDGGEVLLVDTSVAAEPPPPW